jgi:hypothetical protein
VKSNALSKVGAQQNVTRFPYFQASLTKPDVKSICGDGKSCFQHIVQLTWTGKVNACVGSKITYKNFVQLVWTRKAKARAAIQIEPMLICYSDTTS